jgi:hypothetical protein
VEDGCEWGNLEAGFLIAVFVMNRKDEEYMNPGELVQRSFVAA